jgi:hypothetical protein
MPWSTKYENSSTRCLALSAAIASVKTPRLVAKNLMSSRALVDSGDETHKRHVRAIAALLGVRQLLHCGIGRWAEMVLPLVVLELVQIKRSARKAQRAMYTLVRAICDLDCLYWGGDLQTVLLKCLWRLDDGL